MNRNPIVILSEDEINKMRAAGRLAAQLLQHVGQMVEKGVSTLEINDEAERYTRSAQAISGPLGYHGFPKSICTSINNVVCHGIPSPEEILQEGDIINIDVSPILDGFFGDTSRTFIVGKASDEAHNLVEITEACMYLGIKQVGPGKRIGDIGAAIQNHAEAAGYSVVRDFVGHGIGRQFHTEPQIPHFGKKGRGRRLEAGMCFTIEPMINVGSWQVEVLDDGWTAVTQDQKLSAQFEHTILVTKAGYDILTLPDS